MPKDARQQAMIVKVPGYLRHLTLRLFKNNITPAAGSVFTDFTEADFPGYAAQSLNDFSDPFINSDLESESDSAVHTFLCTGTPSGGSQTIFGWFTDFPTGVLGPCARFVPPPVTPEVVLTGVGQSVSVQIL